jgi:uncharacterized OB-fold protein
MRFDLPTPDPTTDEFWAAAKGGKLLIKRCANCRRAHFYPRPFCPHCWSEKVDWEEASGLARLYTWSVVYTNDLPPFADRVPYVAAIVDLVEGPRMMTNVVDCDVNDLTAGMALKVTFTEEAEGIVIPRFRPADQR